VRRGWLAGWLRCLAEMVSWSLIHSAEFSLLEGSEMGLVRHGKSRCDSLVLRILMSRSTSQRHRVDAEDQRMFDREKPFPVHLARSLLTLICLSTTSV